MQEELHNACLKEGIKGKRLTKVNLPANLRSFTVVGSCASLADPPQIQLLMPVANSVSSPSVLTVTPSCYVLSGRVQTTVGDSHSVDREGE